MSTVNIERHSFRLCVAPMMGITHRDFRYLLRLIAPRARLYTEMIPVARIIRGERSRPLEFDQAEHPLAVQVGGCHPEHMAVAAKMAEDCGYDEINLNVGCPSKRVQAGDFGAVLMKEPRRVADCVSAIKQQVSCPVTIKTRIGVDQRDDFEFCFALLKAVIEAGADAVFVHARKALLKGLNPRQNRSAPPLNYPRVYELARSFPQTPMIINGGIESVAQAQQHLRFVDGVMLGRLVERNPWCLQEFSRELFADSAKDTPAQDVVIRRYLDYALERLQGGANLRYLLIPLYQLRYGVSGARVWRRLLDEIQNTKMPAQLKLREVVGLLT